MMGLVKVQYDMFNIIKDGHGFHCLYCGRPRPIFKVTQITFTQTKQKQERLNKMETKMKSARTRTGKGPAGFSRIVPVDGERMHVSVVNIKPPNFRSAIFKIVGIAPLVVHRFSSKVGDQMRKKMETGKAASSKKDREPQDLDELFNDSRYISPQGWDGFNASAIRASMINVCRLVNFKMTLAKLSIFVEQDGWDKKEPQIPLIRIYGDPVRQDDIGRVETGQPYVTVRAAYREWYARPKIRWDADQFTLDDITNLLARVGLQNGLCEGRPNSKNSCGMGWGLFEVQKGSE